MARRVAVHDVGTPEGTARIHVRESAGSSTAGTLVLGHGAGGGFGAADLTAVTSAGVAAGWRVVQVEQPWKVAGRRIAVAPPRLDVGWLAVLEALPELVGPPGRLVVGGRSAGARVACRTASRVGAVGVCCLAFPLHPPGRPMTVGGGGAGKGMSRAEELELATGLPLIVVQGRTDPFGGPDEVAAVIGSERVHAVTGDHGMKADPKGVAAAVVAWLDGLPKTRSRRSRPPPQPTNHA